MFSEVHFEPYRFEWDREIAELDSTCEQVRRRISWVKRHLFCNFDPLCVSIALHQKKIVGTAMMRVNRYRYQGKQYMLGYLSDVAVHPDLQKQGLGKQLSQRSIDLAEKKGADGIILFTGPDNVAAYRLYQKLGFKDLTKQTTLLWNQNEIKHKGSFTVRHASPEDRDVVMSLIRKEFKNYELYSEQHTMHFNPGQKLDKAGISSYVILKDSEIIGSINFLNYTHVWEYQTPSGLTTPLLVYDFSVKKGIKKADVFYTVMNDLGSLLKKTSGMIVMMADEKEIELLSILKECGFVKMIDGVWMGKSLNNRCLLRPFDKPIFNGFPI